MGEKHSKKYWGVGVVLLLVLSASVAAIVFSQSRHNKALRNSAGRLVDEDDEIETIREVEVIKPRADPAFVLSVREIADVHAYDSNVLMAQVSGRVKRVTKSYGDPVIRGETLVEIDVPELITAVEEKEQVIYQRERERDLAREKSEVAQAHKDVSIAAIAQRRAEVKNSLATLKLRKLMMDRYTTLAAQEASSRPLADEATRDYEVAQSAREAAEAAVDKAIADSREAEASFHAAQAEYKVKESLVEVARKEKKLAEDLASYTRVKADFDGVIVDRKVNEGDLVQNANTGHGKPLLTVARSDIVTVTMRVPDRYAHFVTQETRAVVQVGDLVIQGQVTNVSPSVNPDDRTQHVEVNLYNSTRRDEYDRFVRQLLGHLPAVTTSTVGLGFGVGPFRALTFEALATATIDRACDGTWVRIRKGIDDPMPLFPHITGRGLKGRAQPLLPGEVGRMRLILKEFNHAYLVPSDVVFWRGGQTYLAVVRDNKVHLVEVDVQADDTKLAKIQIIEQEKSSSGEEQNVYRELVGDESIIRGGQSELNEGQEVKWIVKKW